MNSALYFQNRVRQLHRRCLSLSLNHHQAISLQYIIRQISASRKPLIGIRDVKLVGSTVSPRIFRASPSDCLYVTFQLPITIFNLRNTSVASARFLRRRLRYRTIPVPVGHSQLKGLRLRTCR
jgi:hypothetical protein